MRYVSLRQVSQHGGAVRLHNRRYNILVHRKHFGAFSIAYAAGRVSQPVMAADMPGIFGEVIADTIARSWPDSWRPSVFGPATAGLFGWRAIIWPIYCLPFWWLAGRGLDAVFLRRSLHTAWLVLGTVLFALFAFGLTAELCFEDHRRDLIWQFCGLAVWPLLWGSFPAVIVSRTRARRAARVARQSAPSPVA